MVHNRDAASGHGHSHGIALGGVQVQRAVPCSYKYLRNVFISFQ
jgi:hypothetical protein